MTREELGNEIAHEGHYEEFYQKQHNGFMQEFHKRRRLQLQLEYNQKYAPVPASRRRRLEVEGS